MPLTDEQRSKYHELQTCEQWWCCDICGSILAKLRADGVLEIKLGGMVIGVDPQYRAAIIIDCTCRHVNNLIIMKGKGGEEECQADQPKDCTASSP